MNNSEIFLLSLINQSPRYGYEISQFLEETNANLWINISMPYVYRLLNGFNDKGMVSCKSVPSENRPNKNVYQITPKGRLILSKAIKEKGFSNDRVFFGMDVALAVYAITNKSFNLRAIVAEQIKKTKEALDQFDLENTSDEVLTDEGSMAVLIIRHHLKFYESELEWLTKVQEFLQ